MTVASLTQNGTLFDREMPNKRQFCNENVSTFD
jgi:hypothetical protein